ncbi:hypothetical protein A3C96_04000 [Candidatus Uhrbacteria bacterium RIFCSPHIGHO2_02_FULL_60_10]|uniref:Uncharacterized protein n=1 Tax=Candidatus Uhrbacteria bacterium RIFCSPHIGHO2_02_FULL_60_10 TaxID=1802392 RepID=A0A1F7U884_9BACT|nr:MAG: hypothetical protein A3C96_04000 [Candidatus Uhrbacteria bacterium RIFCSPHIGHO2_02_FULL_60_10]
MDQEQIKHYPFLSFFFDGYPASWPPPKSWSLPLLPLLEALQRSRCPAITDYDFIEGPIPRPHQP